MRKLINHCIDHGIHGIFVCGSNGECMSLDAGPAGPGHSDCAGRMRRGRVPVLAGCMDSSTQRVIENVQRLEEMGGTTAVVTPVFDARHATQEETVRHFEEISKNTNANLMIYNIPLHRPEPDR
ncbi:MAG: dihydrodipicolinate synthase family protein [Dysosmobacter sp.]